MAAASRWASLPICPRAPRRADALPPGRRRALTTIAVSRLAGPGSDARFSQLGPPAVSTSLTAPMSIGGRHDFARPQGRRQPGGGGGTGRGAPVAGVLAARRLVLDDRRR